MGAQPTTRWQVNGYRFLVRRMEHALVRRDVRMIHDPMRSQSRALAVGAVLACVGLAGCAALALLRPQDRIGDAAIVVGRDSGAMLVTIDGAFHPVLNLASARLVLGRPEAPAVVADGEFETRPRGPLVGIPGAPSALAHVAAPLPWTVCDTVTTDGSRSVTTTVTGGEPAYGERVRPLADDEALLVAADGRHHLVYRGSRAEVDLADQALTRVLGIDAGMARPVGPGLLAAIPEVPRLEAPRIPGAGGEPGYPIGSLTVGSVVRVAVPDGKRFYVVLRDGVQEVSEATAQIVHFTDSQGAAEIPAVAPDVLREAPTVRGLAVDTFPATVPTVVDARDRPVACLTWIPGVGAAERSRSVVEVSAGSVLPLPDGAVPVSLAQADGAGPEADSAYLAPGRGAFVQTTSVAPDSARRGALFYVADTGVRYGIVDAEAATALGFSEPVPAPWQIVELFAPGPALGRAEALVAHDGVAPDHDPAPVGAGR
ncbi:MULTISPECIES: type VII secretion protein EccB [Rhodococcus]|uniref:type VII secretion protein EccB n=1 Tax=Rhodococcus TaxID=1827 RepID=UPI00143ECAF5|nr:MULTISPECIES: type VII secretion protein EccB [Rhodococcus]QIX51356.1 type VII secretion protein EccB [Rhodococcus sp. DMU1]QRI78484.1 type VII secretion protein EccB [Rhodococcus aetherivorans]QSE61900.1 type VII secretion protein EccB [Rhodococcus sp. PSBB066]QSE71710.1 type VII secretion protein EccB [Rhodococcus sp. PSBB049]